jgi:replicative DNA helicase
MSSFPVPASVEAEAAVLGGLFIEPALFERVRTLVSADDFYLQRYRTIFSAMEQVAAADGHFDVLIIADRLRADNTLDDVGGMAALVGLMNETPTALHTPLYAELVARTGTRRRLAALAETLRQDALNEALTLEEVLRQSEVSFVEISRLRRQESVISLQDALQSTEQVLGDRLRLHRLNPDYVLGVAAGLQELDTITDGLRPGVTTLAGSTSMGKTALALTVALNASAGGLVKEVPTPAPAHVHLFSGEMTQEQMNWRLLAMKSGLPMRQLERGDLTPAQLHVYRQAVAALADLHVLSFESGKRLSLLDIRNRVRELSARQELDLLILDGLFQIDAMPPVPERGSQRTKARALVQRRDLIEQVMNDLEEIAMTAGLPILLTHQVSRAPASRADRRPTLSDLSDASFVEQKSAVVWFVYRDWYYDRSAPENMAEIIVAKNRHGQTGTARVYFDPGRTLFQNADIQRVNLAW